MQKKYWEMQLVEFNFDVLYWMLRNKVNEMGIEVKIIPTRKCFDID